MIRRDSQQVPGWDQRVEEYCKSTGSFARNFTAQRKALYTPSSSPPTKILFFCWRPPPPGLVILPLADAEVTWKILVVWRRVRACGALKALLDALLTVTPKGSEAKWIL